MYVHYEVRLHPEVPGTAYGRCPHCGATGALARHAMGSSMGVFALTAREALRCLTCDGHSQRPWLLTRVLGALVLVPFFALLAGTGGGGVWMVQSMLRAGLFNPGLAVVALIMTALGGYFGWRTARRLRDLLVPGRLTPLVGLIVRV